MGAPAPAAPAAPAAAGSAAGVLASPPAGAAPAAAAAPAARTTSNTSAAASAETRCCTEKRSPGSGLPSGPSKGLPSGPRLVSSTPAVAAAGSSSYLQASRNIHTSIMIQPKQAKRDAGTRWPTRAAWGRSARAKTPGSQPRATNSVHTSARQSRARTQACRRGPAPALRSRPA